MSNTGLPKILVLIRHGESRRNTAKKSGPFFKNAAERDAIASTPDHLTPLTDEGHRQATETGLKLKERFGVPDEIVHSGYIRTFMTGQHVLEAYAQDGPQPIVFRSDHRLRERDPGYCFNMTGRQVQKHFPWLKQYWKETPAFFARPPGGESLGDVVNQLESFVSELRTGKKDRTTFVVSHGNTIRCLRFLIEGLTYDQVGKMRWPPNCGIVAYRFEARGTILLSDNERLWTP